MILRTLKRMWEDAVRLSPWLAKQIGMGVLIASLFFLPMWGLVGILDNYVSDRRQIGVAIILLAMVESLLALWFGLTWNNLKYEDAREETHIRIYGDKNE